MSMANLTDLDPMGVAPWASALFTGVGVGVAVTGGLFNLTAVAVLATEALKRRSPARVTPDTILVFQLALVDLLYCTVSLPLLLVTGGVGGTGAGGGRRPPRALCAAAAFVRIVNATVEFNTLGLVAFERFYHINRGRRAGGGCFSVRLTRLCCVALWLLCTLLQLPLLAGGQYGFNGRTLKCDLTASGRVRVLVVLAECLLPLAVILACYAAILRQVRRSKALLARYAGGRDCRSGGQPTRLIRRYRAACRSLLGLVVLYAVCILPLALYNMVGQDGRWKEAGVLIYCLYWLQYVANTLIYVMSSPRYRVAVKAFLKGVFRRALGSRRRLSCLPDRSPPASVQRRKPVELRVF